MNNHGNDSLTRNKVSATRQLAPRPTRRGAGPVRADEENALKANRLTVALLLALAGTGLGNQALAEGHLLAVGGMLRASNVPVYAKFVELAGGAQQARIAIMPTASGSLGSSRRFRAELVAMGVPEARISIIDIDRKNYQKNMNDPAVLQPLADATAVWFVGGDQSRIARALFNTDGSPSQAWHAIHAVKQRGGVIGGTSAGASIQGKQMPTAYGVVMDTLDFGLGQRADMRGVSILPGAGFFDGIIDQHLDKLEETSSGRVGRMAAYLSARGLARGYGLDTNTAMWVKPDGTLEVLGEGYLTVMDASAASYQKTLYGSRIGNVRLSMLGSGDRYDPANGTLQPRDGKAAIAAGDAYLNGNSLIADLSAVNAVGRAVLYGLADNTAQRQQGLMVRYNPANGYHYGYRFSFSKGERFAAWSSFVDSQTNYTVRDIRLDIEPVDARLGDPARTTPTDIARSRQPQAVKAVVFRGLMTTDEQGRFWPQRPVTRAELANTLQMLLGGELNAKEAPALNDLAADHPLREQIAIVVSQGWMGGSDRFWPDAAITRQELAIATRAMYEGFQRQKLSERATLQDAGELQAGYDDAAAQVVAAGLLTAPGGRFNGMGKVTRDELAQLVARIAGL